MFQQAQTVKEEVDERSNDYNPGANWMACKFVTRQRLDEILKKHVQWGRVVGHLCKEVTFGVKSIKVTQGHGTKIEEEPTWQEPDRKVRIAIKYDAWLQIINKKDTIDLGYVQASFYKKLFFIFNMYTNFLILSKPVSLTRTPFTLGVFCENWSMCCRTQTVTFRCTH